MDKPEALRLADEIDAIVEDGADPDLVYEAAAELRRLHAENASLAAALASSCDEQRHQLWESGGIAGCERARVAERQRDALLEALERMASIIDKMGDMPDGFIHPSPWRELKCEEALTQARAAIKAVEEGK